MRASGITLPESTPADKSLEADFEMEDSMADYVPPDWTSEPVEDSITVRSRRLHPALPFSRTIHDINHLFRYAKNLLGLRSDEETFDVLWKSLVIKDEQRILRNIKTVSI